MLEPRAIDCTFSKADYIDFKPHLVMAHHIRRYGKNRAMFAVPDSLIGLPHRGRERRERPAHGTDRRRVYESHRDPGDAGPRNAADAAYTWCFIHVDSQAIIPEYGNGNIDADVLFGQADLPARFMTDCVLEHFELTASPIPTLPASPRRRAGRRRRAGSVDTRRHGHQPRDSAGFLGLLRWACRSALQFLARGWQDSAPVMLAHQPGRTVCPLALIDRDRREIGSTFGLVGRRDVVCRDAHEVKRLAHRLAPRTHA